MSDTNLDWTFDDIPADDETSPATLAAPRRAAPLVRHLGLRRWLLLIVPAATVVLALGAYVFARLGWSRLQTQVTAEIVFEDERSAARDVAAVGALQVAEDFWRLQREAEAQLGLAAPLPAPNLLPTGAPPRLVSFRTAGDNLFEATVVRQYADAAGQRFDFELTQRYHNLGAGLWERMPPDHGSLADLTLFASDRLTATFPVADLPWMQAALPQFEYTLALACIDWQCPDGFKLSVAFQPQFNSLLGVQRTVRPAAASAAGYPLIFDMPPVTASYQAGRVYRLPSPHAAGYPRDERAAAALTRAVSVQLLAALAAELSGDNRRLPDYFLDALIARAEIRLGLSPTPALAFAPHDFLMPVALWRMAGLGDLAQVSDSLPLRHQALGFVNFALADQPPSVDGALLRSLRDTGHPSLWLYDVLGRSAGEMQSRWRAAALAQASAPATPRADYAGLVLVCGDQAVVVGADGLQRLSAHPQGQTVISAELARDGRRLAALIAGRSSTKLVVFNLEDGTQQPLPVAQPGVLLGWLPTGELLYLEVHPANGSSNFWRLMRLRQYDPITRKFSTVIDDPIVLPWSERGLWSPDGHTLSLAVYAGEPGEATPVLTLVTPVRGQHVAVQTLPTSGYAPAFSPAGDQLAVFSGGDPFLAQSNGDDWRLNLVDWQTNQLTTVLSAAEVDGGANWQIGALDWSPDGGWLSFVAVGPGTGPVAFLAPAAGGSAVQLDGGAQNAGSQPLGFSADSRYLATIVYPGTFVTNVVEVFDLAAPPGTAPQRFLAQTAAWSPRGHDLLLAGAGGLHAIDAATGAAHWLYDTPCGPESS